MNYRRFFSMQHWWGKLIGGCLGYLIFGPAGAFFGILIGNLFDKGLALHFSRPYWQLLTLRRKNVRNAFFESTFLVMGHISKADGHVSLQQINMACQLMQDMHLNTAQQKQAQQLFNKGKRPDFDLQSILLPLRAAINEYPELVKIFLDIQFQMAIVGGLTIKKQQILNTVLNYFGYAPLNEQHRFYEDFTKESTSGKTYHQYSANTSSSTKSRSDLDYAYSILGLQSTAGKQEVKRAYQKLISRNHPDKLIAQGLPESMIKLATEKTQQIRKAYERICEFKGW